MVSFSFSVCTAALQNSIPFLLEHPEDLGMTATGHTPASIWQLPEAVALYTHENVMTFAVYQCQFGAASPKPTRFLSSIPAAATMRFMGPPSFDSSDRYTGPLPRYCGHSHRQRLLGAGSTSAAAAYPPDLCKAIATWTFSVFDGGGEQLCNIWHRHLEIVEMVFISRLERPRSDRRPLQWSIWLLNA